MLERKEGLLSLVMCFDEMLLLISTIIETIEIQGGWKGSGHFKKFCMIFSIYGVYFLLYFIG